MTSDNTPTTQPVPTPFCLLYAPLLPLLDGDLLDRGQASEVRGHVHTCAWCQAQLATYAVVDTVLRRHYGVTPSRGSATHDARAIPERAITLADVQRTSRRNARAATFLFLSTPMRQASRNQLNISPVPLDSLGAIAATVLVAVLLSLFIRVRLTQTSVSRETPRQLVPSCQVVQGKSLCEFALPTPNLQPSAIVLGTDGAMWFIEQVQNGPEKIGRLTPRGGFTEFSLPTVGGAVRDLTVGPDGAIWFTEQSSGGASIGRISSSGRITTFAFPISGIYANSITAGPDGALWFTEQGNINMRGSNKVGRITTTGHITEFSVTQQDMPIAITAGSGAWLWYLWFNGQGSFVTRITPTGTVLSNVMLSTTVLPVGGMTSGSDGNLWITDSQNDAILRITPAGTVSRFVVPPRSGLASIVAGPDGAIWFTEQLSNVVGRIVPSGAITTYPIRTANSGALGIARGANNSIWFTELSGNAIGRLV